jgi:signal transduction histidine kinase
VQAGDDARRQVERDLHDGAQQRLVSLSLLLRHARSEVGGTAVLDEAVEQLDEALRELRDLARGVYPMALIEGGLAAALDGLVERSPIATTIADVPEGRLPEPVEAAAYFVVNEAMTNAAKHSNAASVTVSVRSEDELLVVEVSDDGSGGATPDAGGGLRGLRDRVEALDGTIAIVSPVGAGTVVRAELPCASS